MNHTQNYQLSQWEMSDRIQMEDFNADNAKIEAALQAEAAARTGDVAALNAALALRGSCQFYQTTCGGGGTLTFPHKPMVVFIAGGGFNFFAVQGVTIYSSYGITVGFTWEGNSLIISPFNANNQTLQVVALLDLTQ